MTNDEMIEWVKNELRNTKIDSLISTWLKQAAVNLANQYKFPAFNVSTTINTAGSNPDVVLPADFHWLIAHPSLVSSVRPLDPWDENDLSSSFPDYRTLEGQITHYYLRGRTICFYQVPSTIQSVNIHYQAIPASAEDLPEQLHSIIVQEAIISGYSRDGDNAGMERATLTKRQLFRPLIAGLIRRPDYPLVVGVNNRSGKKPPYPRLPANYPSR